MENHSYLQDFNEEDLIAFRNRDKIFRIKQVKDSCKSTLSVPINKSGNYGKTAQALQGDFNEQIVHASGWLAEGVNCEVLRLGDQQWTKERVKVRIIVEFESEAEVEKASGLDVFRDDEN